MPATDLPDDFTLEDLHWPMPAMGVEFPARFRQEYLGRDSGYGRCGRVEVPTSRPGGGLAGKIIGGRSKRGSRRHCPRHHPHLPPRNNRRGCRR